MAWAMSEGAPVDVLMCRNSHESSDREGGDVRMLIPSLSVATRICPCRPILTSITAMLPSDVALSGWFEWSANFVSDGGSDMVSSPAVVAASSTVSPIIEMRRTDVAWGG